MSNKADLGRCAHLLLEHPGTIFPLISSVYGKNYDTSPIKSNLLEFIRPLQSSHQFPFPPSSNCCVQKFSRGAISKFPHQQKYNLQEKQLLTRRKRAKVLKSAQERQGLTEPHRDRQLVPAPLSPFTAQTVCAPLPQHRKLQKLHPALPLSHTSASNAGSISWDEGLRSDCDEVKHQGKQFSASQN